MRFTETKLAGAFLVDVERHEDHRGFNARAWCRRELEDMGLEADLAQANVVFNPRRGTLRGMHFQHPPFGETKLVRVTRGAVYDVIVDLRAESPTFGQWAGFELTAETRQALYVPKRFAHGLLTLEDDTEVSYLVTEYYTPGHEGGLVYDDPGLGIEWPAEMRLISDKDRSWPAFDRDAHGLVDVVEPAR